MLVDLMSDRAAARWRRHVPGAAVFLGPIRPYQLKRVCWRPPPVRCQAGCLQCHCTPSLCQPNHRHRLLLAPAGCAMRGCFSWPSPAARPRRCANLADFFEGRHNKGYADRTLLALQACVGGAGNLCMHATLVAWLRGTHFGQQVPCRPLSAGDPSEQCMHSAGPHSVLQACWNRHSWLFQEHIRSIVMRPPPSCLCEPPLLNLVYAAGVCPSSVPAQA